MKLSILTILLALAFNGCTKSNKPEPESFKSPILGEMLKNKDTNLKKLQEVAGSDKKYYKAPTISESKYIDILIMPFQISDDDLDYGGTLKTKLEDSKIVFDDQIKKEISQQHNIIGGIN